MVQYLHFRILEFPLIWGMGYDGDGYGEWGGWAGDTCRDTNQYFFQIPSTNGYGRNISLNT